MKWKLGNIWGNVGVILGIMEENMETTISHVDPSERYEASSRHPRGLLVCGLGSLMMLV